MRSARSRATLALVVCLLRAVPAAAAPLPDALVDLRTAEGARLVGASWRWQEARVVEAEHRGPGPDRRATGVPVRTHDLVPRPGTPAFEEGWGPMAPEALEERRTGGRLAFAWYRAGLTLPERIADVPVAGCAVVFEVVVDDYAEVWVDGRLPLTLGQTAGPTASGFNAPTRVVLTQDARPGQRFDVAVLGANGPLSAPPANFVWVRSATIEVYRPAPPDLVATEVVRLDAALDAAVPAGAQLERLATGFRFGEGPVWLPEEAALLFSDPAANLIARWSPATGTAVWHPKSGYTGADVARWRQPGSNGLALDRHGRVTVCQHGNRRVVRIERTGAETVLADRFDGKRLNSPNDLAYAADGTLCFTDPPFGLPGGADDRARELRWSGVYCLRDGVLHLVDAGLAGPNGIGFSPNGRWMYVTNGDPARKLVVRYAVGADGLPRAPAETLADLGDAESREGEALDGLEVDRAGRLWVAGPTGVWVLAADGRRLGVVRGPELPANLAWGDDGRTLYVTARTGLYRLRTVTEGAVGPEAGPAVVRRDPRLDAVVPPGARPERVADGFVWTEGPVWREDTEDLLFSDVPRNVVQRWTPGRGATVFLERAGWTGQGLYPGREPGANGLALDASGRLVLCEHGDRRVSRLEPDGTRTVLADRYHGRRLNSPNDVAIAPGGDVLFTDPPFGLPGWFDDPARELRWSGVYRVGADGMPRLLTIELRAPNGLALSPDGGTLYVSNADPARPVWMAYPVRRDGGLGSGRVFADATAWARVAPGLPDGLEVDARGVVFAAGPGGVYVFAADGVLLGFVDLGVATGNVTLGEGGRALYVTAGPAVWRLPLAGGNARAAGGPGAVPWPGASPQG